MSQLVFNVATDATGRPTNRQCGCGRLAGICSCRPTHNAASESQAQSASRDAAMATVRAIPKAGAAGRLPEHDDAAMSAGRGIRATSKNRFAAAARHHDAAAYAHQSAAESALFTGDRFGHENQMKASDLHKAAAQTCRDCAGTPTNANGSVPVNGAIVPPTNNYALYPGASPRLLAALGIGPAVSNESPSGMHSFDQTLGDTGDVDDDSIDRQYSDYWDATKRKLSSADFLQQALADDFLTEENRKRQGLDTGADKSMSNYYRSRPDLYSDPPARNSNAGVPPRVQEFVGSLTAEELTALRGVQQQGYSDPPTNNNSSSNADVPVYLQNVLTTNQINTLVGGNGGVECGPMGFGAMSVLEPERRSEMVHNMTPEKAEKMFARHLRSHDSQRTEQLVNNACRK